MDIVVPHVPLMRTYVHVQYGELVGACMVKQIMPPITAEGSIVECNVVIRSCATPSQQCMYIVHSTVAWCPGTTTPGAMLELREQPFSKLQVRLTGVRSKLRGNMPA